MTLLNSIRYSRARPRTAVIEFFNNLARAHGIALVSKSDGTLLGFSQAMLDEAAKELRVGEALAELNEKASIDPERLAALKRHVPVTHYIYEDSSRGIRLNVDLAMGNEFRCIGIDIWRSKELELPGGFVKVTAENDKDVSEIIQKIDLFCKRNDSGG